MARFEDHCAESERLFGKAFAEVHRWLDEYAGQPGIGSRHRRKRHHEAGIREAARLFGPDAEAVARQHILTDLKEEDWNEGDPFPVDEDHYVRLGLW